MLSYNIILWGQASDIERVCIIQKRIIRVMLSLSYNCPSRNDFKVLQDSNKREFCLNVDFHNYEIQSPLKTGKVRAILLTLKVVPLTKKVDVFRFSFLRENDVQL